VKDNSTRPITILMADDDQDDCMLVSKAFEEGKILNDLRFVENGEELMDYLYRRTKYADAQAAPRPGLILLDLNMPRKDGREALKEIKNDAGLREIPVVVFTT
jgi:CheY-like chemotaxis protein